MVLTRTRRDAVVAPGQLPELVPRSAAEDPKQSSFEEAFAAAPA
jgi:hypothetical protein